MKTPWMHFDCIEMHTGAALLTPLTSLSTEGTESRNVLTSAKSLNVLSLKDSGRAAIVGTEGLLDAMADVVRFVYTCTTKLYVH